MTRDLIDEIGIDNKGRLYVRPRQCSFEFIYREAMEVHWNEDKGRLYGPPPRRWSYLQWYNQIIKAAHEQGVNLRLHAETTWSDVPGDLKDEILTTDPNA
jgi:hypothetical protein